MDESNVFGMVCISPIGKQRIFDQKFDIACSIIKVMSTTITRRSIVS